jgi:rod shape-determining protein MreC
MLNKFKRYFDTFKEYIVVVILLIISLSILSQNEKPPIKKLRSFAVAGFAVVNSISNDLINIFQSNDELFKARKTNAELMLKVNMLREYGLENHALKNLMGFKDTSNFTLVPATIISRLISKVHGYFIVNAGSSDSVKIGMPAIVDNGLVGILIDVTLNYSTLRTLQSSDLSIAVRDQRSNVDGIMNWDGNQLVIKNVPTTYDVNVGDRIVTSEFSTIIPPSIPVGIVLEKESTISGLLSNVIVEPYVDLSQTKNLFILKYIRTSQIEELELNLFKKK